MSKSISLKQITKTSRPWPEFYIRNGTITSVAFKEIKTTDLLQEFSGESPLASVVAGIWCITRPSIDKALTLFRNQAPDLKVLTALEPYWGGDFPEADEILDRSLGSTPIDPQDKVLERFHRGKQAVMEDIITSHRLPSDLDEYLRIAAGFEIRYSDASDRLIDLPRWRQRISTLASYEKLAPPMALEGECERLRTHLPQFSAAAAPLSEIARAPIPRWAEEVQRDSTQQLQAGLVVASQTLRAIGDHIGQYLDQTERGPGDEEPWQRRR